MINSKHEGLCVIPDFGDYSIYANGSETLPFSCSVASLLHCAASLWRKDVGDVLLHIPVWSLDTEATCLFPQVMLLWTRHHKHVRRSGDASTRIFGSVRKTGEKRLLDSSCLSAWNNSALIGRICIKFDILVFFEILLRNFKLY